MKTIVTNEDTEKAAKILLAGGFVAVPTETVYGMAVNALDEKAVEALYELKGRPEVKPLSIMVSGIEDIKKYCVNIPEQAYELAEKYWPGPLTIVLDSAPNIPEIVRAGGKTVGLRCPHNNKTIEVIKKAGIPLAVPSANPSGKPSPKSASDVYNYFNGKIEMIVDDGECTLGIESTLINLASKPFSIIREGAVSSSELINELYKNIMIYGITGGSGTGKTTALKYFESKGAEVIDCDALYHDLLENDENLVGEIGQAFPGTVESKKVNRKKLADIVFKDNKKLSELNKITHKYINLNVDNILKKAAINGKRTAVIDAYALAESGISEKCSKVIGIIADDNIRIERIIKRDNITKEAAKLRIAAQNNKNFYFENCDYVIENNATEDEFKLKIENIYNKVVDSDG